MYMFLGPWRQGKHLLRYFPRIGYSYVAYVYSVAGACVFKRASVFAASVEYDAVHCLGGLQLFGRRIGCLLALLEEYPANDHEDYNGD